MGGKGRGLAFLNALLVTVDLGKEFENINVKIPKTAIICTNEFDIFIEKNEVVSSKFRKKSDEEINKFFLN